MWKTGNKHFVVQEDVELILLQLARMIGFLT